MRGSPFGLSSFFLSDSMGVGIHRSCGRELSSLSSFDSRFAVLFLPYGACFCRETWNRYPDRPGNLESVLTLVGKHGIDEGRWYEAAGGMSGVVSVACGFARVMSAQRISSSRASRHPFLVRQGGFPGFRRVFDDIYPRVSGRFVGLSPPVPGLPSYSCRMAPVSVGKPGIGPCDRRETWTRRECVYARRG